MLLGQHCAQAKWHWSSLTSYGEPTVTQRILVIWESSHIYPLTWCRKQHKINSTWNLLKVVFVNTNWVRYKLRRKDRLLFYNVINRYANKYLRFIHFARHWYSGYETVEKHRTKIKTVVFCAILFYDLSNRNLIWRALHYPYGQECNWFLVSDSATLVGVFKYRC